MVRPFLPRVMVGGVEQPCSPGIRVRKSIGGRAAPSEPWRRPRLPRECTHPPSTGGCGQSRPCDAAAPTIGGRPTARARPTIDLTAGWLAGVQPNGRRRRRTDVADGATSMLAAAAAAAAITGRATAAEASSRGARARRCVVQAQLARGAGDRVRRGVSPRRMRCRMRCRPVACHRPSGDGGPTDPLLLFRRMCCCMSGPPIHFWARRRAVVCWPVAHGWWGRCRLLRRSRRRSRRRRLTCWGTTCSSTCSWWC